MLNDPQAMEDQNGRSRFERLYEIYRKMMFQVAYRILGNSQDAEDSVHEAFLRISKNISNISDPMCPKTRAYIVIVVESASIDLYRKRQRGHTLPLDEASCGVPDSSQDGVLDQCILALPAQDREIILLRYSHGYTLRETAQILGISEAAARKRLQRAKEKLEHLCKEAELL